MFGSLANVAAATASIATHRTAKKYIVLMSIHQFHHGQQYYYYVSSPHSGCCMHAKYALTLCRSSHRVGLTIRAIASIASSDNDDDDAKCTANGKTCRHKKKNYYPKPSIIRSKWISLEPITITICNHAVVVVVHLFVRSFLHLCGRSSYFTS